MQKDKLFAGPAIKNHRRKAGMTQVALASKLEISPSYLNLIERNQRPISARLLLLLADRFNFDPRQLITLKPGGGVDDMSRRLSDPLFSELDYDRVEIEEWLMTAPNMAEAFALLFDRQQREPANDITTSLDSVQLVRKEIERWRNYFADLDAMAENLADELRLQAGDLYGAITERLRVKHQLTIRILPESVLPDSLRRLDLHARQLQLSEMLGPSSRTFQAASLLGQIEAKAEIDALVSGAGFSDQTAEKLYRRHLTGYFAAALMMPYARFMRACEQTEYQIPILQRRFGAGFEQVAHRLTTLQRVGERGLPFFMIRIDRAGQISKRYAGASKVALVESERCCPLWNIHRAFEQSATMLTQLLQLEDGSSWFTISQAVKGTGAGAGGQMPEYVVGLGIEAGLAGTLSHARGMQLSADRASSIGLGCRSCTRTQCSQRSAPPRNRNLHLDEQERGLSPFDFVED